MKKNKTLIIAEAGVNHNGSFKIAKKLIDVASRAGADIVKFQTFKTDSFLIKKTPKANYQKKSSMKNQTQNQMLEKLELNYKKLLI